MLLDIAVGLSLLTPPPLLPKSGFVLLPSVTLSLKRLSVISNEILSRSKPPDKNSKPPPSPKLVLPLTVVLFSVAELRRRTEMPPPVPVDEFSEMMLSFTIKSPTSTEIPPPFPPKPKSSRIPVVELSLMIELLIITLPVAEMPPPDAEIPLVELARTTLLVSVNVPTGPAESIAVKEMLPPSEKVPLVEFPSSVVDTKVRSPL